MANEQELLKACRSMLYKYSDEVEYQLNERHHENEGLAEWQEDKRQVDHLLAQLARYFEVTDGE